MDAIERAIVMTRPDPAVPPLPETLAETGLSEAFVSGLVLKALYVRGEALGVELFDQLALPMSVLDDVIEQLQEWRLVEVHATRGPRRGEWMFRLTTAGRKRAAEELEVSRYVGPAPVPFDDWVRCVEMQAPERARFSESELRRAFAGVVLPDGIFDLLGPAINSGRSLFLHGGPGNGKTLLAERIARLFGDRYYVPYSVLVDGSVMIVHDPVLHDTERAAVEVGANGGTEEDTADHTRREILRPVSKYDRRYAEARRAVVVTGGELTLEQLDLQWDPSGRMYQAPPQLKAAGGVLVVDDLGRQRVPVRDLLNRWVVPLEHRRDYLTLRSGRKIVVPFDCFVIFSTNLEPGSLADEAFLRRIHYKIHVPDPDREEYTSIFRACCEERQVPFDESAVDFLYDRFYADGTVTPRRCHPRTSWSTCVTSRTTAARRRDSPRSCSPTRAAAISCRPRRTAPRSRSESDPMNHDMPDTAAFGGSTTGAASDAEYRIRESEARLERRIAGLEARLVRGRWLARLGAASVVVSIAAAVVVFRALAPGDGVWAVDSVSTREVVLRDTDGIERGRLATDPDGRAHLALSDREGRARIRLTVLADGSPGVTIHDAEARPRAVLGYLPDGTANLVFADAEGVSRAVLGLEPDGSTQALFADRFGTLRTLIGVGADGAPSVSTFPTP